MVLKRYSLSAHHNLKKTVLNIYQTQKFIKNAHIVVIYLEQNKKEIRTTTHKSRLQDNR